MNINFEVLKSQLELEIIFLTLPVPCISESCGKIYLGNNAQYSRRECLKTTGIPSSVTDKDVEEVVAPY